MNELPSIASFDYSKDSLRIGGYSVTDLASRAGQTPFYAYSRRALTATVERLRQELPTKVKLYYSLKANPMPALVCHLAQLVDGFDVASATELRLALDAGMPAQQCILTGPAKTEKELAAAIANGVIVNLESVEQMRITAKVGKELGVRPSVQLRLNAEFAPTQGNMKAYDKSAFGIDIAEAPKLFEQMSALNLKFTGFHVFWGSQVNDADVITQTQKQAYDQVMELANRVPIHPQSINIGGGLAAHFYESDHPVDLVKLGSNMHNWLDETNNSTSNKPSNIIMELGRYLVAESGVYICRIIDRKTIRGDTFLVTDGGLHHHLAASGSFGQIQKKNYWIRAANRLQQPERETVNIVGRLCSSLDRIADNIRLPKTEIGDYISIFHSGAYGPSFSPAGFLSHSLAIEMLV